MWKDPVDSRRVDPDLKENPRLDTSVRMISTLRLSTEIASKLPVPTQYYKVIIQLVDIS